MNKEKIANIIDDAQELQLPTQNKEHEVELLCVDDVEMVPINWLWKDRIARGKITVIAGQPGLGKSQITAMLCAHITASIAFPDGAIIDAGDVIILSAEDDVSDTIKPRLIAAKADLKRCHFLDGIKIKINGEDAVRMFDLTQDIAPLENIIKLNGNVKLLIIDPVSAYQGQTDSHGNAEMRTLLSPYSKMAAKYNVSIVLVTHFNKSNSQEPLERVIGSIGLIAAARAGYAVIKDDKDESIRYLVPIKNNIGNDKDGFAFHIDGVTLQHDIETSCICWHSEPIKAQKVLNPEAEKKPTQTSAAAAFLQEILSDGPMLATDVFDNAAGAGYSKSTIQRAKSRIGAKTRKCGFDKGWVWYLVDDEDRASETIQSS